MSSASDINFSRPVLGIVAFSGTGKTTLLTQLIPLFHERGIHIAVIKHAHHDVDIDNPAKDTYKMRQAGASPVILTSQQRTAIMIEHADSQAPGLNELLGYLNPAKIDLVLVEGFKELTFNKLFLFRKQIKNRQQEIDDNVSRIMNQPHTLAIVTDLAPTEIKQHLITDKPVLDINNVTAIAELIQNYMHTEAHHD